MHTLSFNENELRVIRKLSTPIKIQDYLETLPINFEKNGDTCMSPRRVLREKKAHCAEGALFAAATLWCHGEPPLLLDLVSANNDYDHIVALFRRQGRWGALSKTNHAVLRYREPVYRTPRELALSYFHEYFTDDGRKTLRTFSRPFDLRRVRDQGWVTAEDNVWRIIELLDSSPHVQIGKRGVWRTFRRADPIEIKAGKLTQFKK